MTFNPEKIRYKGRRDYGSHVSTMLSYSGSQIVFTAAGGYLTVSIAARDDLPAGDIAAWLGIDPSRPVEESVAPLFGGQKNHLFRQEIPRTGV